MTTARDTPPPDQTTASAGGKLRKTPLRRRNIPATPYARPPTAIRNKNPNLLTKIIDPASRLLYAGANKLFGVVFGNRNLSLRPSETNEEPQNVPREEGQRGNSASISAATGISDLEQMLQQKTFTRSEIERLTALLHSRTNESSSAGVVERDGANPCSSPSSLLRLEASSGSVKKHGDERDNLHAAISTPMVTSSVFEEEIASPAELAKTYMGSRPTTKVALRQDLVLHNNPTGFLKSPNTSIAPKIANGSTGFENGFTTPRSRGRSAMYSMARTPYARSPSTFTQKGITRSYGREEALTSSQSAFQHGGKMALKRRSSVLDDDIGSGGPLRRTRQKANLLTLRDKRELGYTAVQQPDHASQKLLLMNNSEPKVVKGAEQNRDTSMHGSGSVSGYTNVPTKSTQTATKILQHLEKSDLKENSGSTKSPTKLTLDMLHGQALRSLEKQDPPKLLSYSHDIQKSEVQHHERLHDNRELTSKGKEKVEDNGPRKVPIPRNMMSSVNGELSVTSKDKAPAVRINETPLKLRVEPPQQKHAFQMSAPEDDSFEIDDDDDETQVNGHVSIPLVESNKQETALAADIVATSTLPGVSRTPALVENNKKMFPEVVKVLEQAEPKESEKPVSSPKIDVGSNSVTTNGHAKLTESNKVENGTDQKSANIFGKVESNKTESGSYQQPANIFGKSESKDGNGNDQKAANIFGILDAPASTALPGTPTNGIFSFGTSTNTTPNTTPLSNPTTFSSTSIASTDTTTTVISTTTPPTPAAIFSTYTPTPVIPSSVPAPVFSFGSATSTTPTVSVAETGNTSVTNDKDLKSNLTNSPFATIITTTTTTTTGSGPFGFSSPAVTSTANNQSQASFFNVSNGSQANTQASVAVTPSVPFLFGSGTTPIPSSTSGTSFLSSPLAIGTSSSFGISSMTASSEGKSGNSTSGPATSVFGSTWEPAKSSGFGTTFNFGASAIPTPSATTLPVVFGASSTGGSTGFSFGAGATSSFSTPTQNQSSFGNPTPVFGTPTPVFGTGATHNNNDHMSMDSMAEDSMQTPTPVPAFGQTPVASPGFMFGSATPTPTPSPAIPSFQFGGQPNQALSQIPAPASASFQFGGQPNQAPSQNPIPASASFQFGGQTNQTPQNPFQSSSAEFNAGGGSFSLGSNGGDKSSRRIVRVRKTTSRKK